MNPQTIILTPKNAAGLAWVVKLTGLSMEEVANRLLSDLVEEFQPSNRSELMANTFGSWKFAKRKNAERRWREWPKKS
jgi:hypothetical protein